MDDIYEIQADVLRALSNARRLEIIHWLAQGPCDVKTLADRLSIAQPNLSQHLALMRSTGIVEGERRGREIRYRLVDPDIVRACGLMRGVIERRVARLADATQTTGSVSVDRPRPATSQRF